MDKIDRNYQLYVQRQDGDTLRITLPFTIEFDITRNILGSANTASFRIYNLDKENRNELRFNMYNYSQFRSVKLYAGYGKNLSLIFLGNMTQAWAVREGVNFISQIECFDSGFGFVNSPFETTFPAGTNQVDQIKTIAKSVPQVTVGAVSPKYAGTISRANPTNGNAADLIREITGGGFFIDNGVLHCLQNNECLVPDVPIVNSESGLLGTPFFEQGILSFDIIFEPRLKVGQLLQLQSLTDNTFNGFFKVTSLKHHGLISSAVCGDAITSVGCLTGVGQLQTVAA